MEAAMVYYKLEPRNLTSTASSLPASQISKNRAANSKQFSISKNRQSSYAARNFSYFLSPSSRPSKIAVKSILKSTHDFLYTSSEKKISVGSFTVPENAKIKAEPCFLMDISKKILSIDISKETREADVTRMNLYIDNNEKKELLVGSKKSIEEKELEPDDIIKTNKAGMAALQEHLEKTFASNAPFIDFVIGASGQALPPAFTSQLSDNFKKLKEGEYYFSDNLGSLEVSINIIPENEDPSKKYVLLIFEAQKEKGYSLITSGSEKISSNEYRTRIVSLADAGQIASSESKGKILMRPNPAFRPDQERSIKNHPALVEALSYQTEFNLINE